MVTQPKTTAAYNYILTGVTPGFCAAVGCQEPRTRGVVSKWGEKIGYLCAAHAFKACHKDNHTGDVRWW